MVISNHIYNGAGSGIALKDTGYGHHFVFGNYCIGNANYGVEEAATGTDWNVIVLNHVRYNTNNITTNGANNLTNLTGLDNWNFG